MPMPMPTPVFVQAFPRVSAWASPGGVGPWAAAPGRGNGWRGGRAFCWQAPLRTAVLFRSL